MNKATVDDDDFVQRLEDCACPLSEFNHRAHLRLAYVVLCECRTEEACLRIRQLLCQFLTHHGIDPETKYHETMTRAWVLAVRHFMNETPQSRSADEFLERNPQLLDATIMDSHYTSAALHSPHARQTFVPPDLQPIPH